MIRHLRPAGERIRLQRAPLAESPLWRGVSEDRVRFYQSGTASLAAALIAAVPKRDAISRPEVLMPAYGCPDLVSAAVYAGVRPVLVDLVPHRPWLDLDDVARKSSPRTVALIAINFLGIDERVAELSELGTRHGWKLVYDCAQSLEAGLDTHGVDYRILSFGRGKPVTLLGGGAVIAASHELQQRLPSPSLDYRNVRAATSRFAIRAALYNLLTRPRAYALPASLPFLELGVTRYKPLQSLQAMTPPSIQFLSVNSTMQTKARAASIQLLREAFAQRDSAASTLDLPIACGHPPQASLLRYPVLLPDAEARDAALGVLNEQRLGGSALYGRGLSDIEGAADHVHAEGVAVARNFAQRLLTLPVHSDVTALDVKNAIAIVDTVA